MTEKSTHLKIGRVQRPLHEACSITVDFEVLETCNVVPVSGPPSYPMYLDDVAGQTQAWILSKTPIDSGRPP
jgi:hypothetical protein